MGNIDKSKKILFRLWPYIVLFAIALIFLIGSSYYNWQGQSPDFIKWSSPDETANYTFAKLYAEEGRLEIPEPYNDLVKDIMHPRSFRVFDGVLKPMSFLGIILLYGKIASMLGSGVIPYLTPFFGALGIVFYFFILKDLFSRNIALVGAALLAIFPIYFYYSSKSMFHNILFISMLLGGTCFLIKAVRWEESKKADWQRIVLFILSGLMFGWAIATRTSELLWLGPVMAVTYAMNFRKIKLWEVLILLGSLIFALTPIFYVNNVLYGGPFRSGYAEVNTSISTLADSSGSLINAGSMANFYKKISAIFETIFYFGFHPKSALKLFLRYSQALTPWLLTGSVIGFTIWIARFKQIKRGQLTLLVAFLVFSAILIIYYGSWDFHDNPDKSAITIGNSYTRYWLPIYLVLVAWFAFALEETASLIKKSWASWSIKIAIIAAIAFASFNLVFGANAESLTTLISKKPESLRQYQEVLKLTEPNAVIITKYQDKLFFPQRKVVYGLFDDDNMIREYARLTEHLPTYYFSFGFSPKDLAYLNKRRLPKFGFRLVKIEAIGDFALYKLVPLKK